jgi:hypothetical protein
MFHQAFSRNLFRTVESFLLQRNPDFRSDLESKSMIKIKRHKRALNSMAAVLMSLAVIAIATPLTAAEGLTLSWSNNMLRVTGTNLPGGTLDTWYLEAFCRRGSTDRDWRQTTIPHRTEAINVDSSGRYLLLRTIVEPNVEIWHHIQAGPDEVTFRLRLENKGEQPVDVEWFQPCMRVDRFTGLAQSNYFSRCFVFTEAGLTTLDKTRRTEVARYRGGQVYVPKGIDRGDVNPRPISLDEPINGLIGCFSADGGHLLATAWDHTQELFQGVIVCIHNDPRIGGLKPHEVKRLKGKLYFLQNDPARLIERYQRDFPNEPLHAEPSP